MENVVNTIYGFIFTLILTILEDSKTTGTWHRLWLTGFGRRMETASLQVFEGSATLSEILTIFETSDETLVASYVATLPSFYKKAASLYIDAIDLNGPKSPDALASDYIMQTALTELALDLPLALGAFSSYSFYAVLWIVGLHRPVRSLKRGVMAATNLNFSQLSSEIKAASRHIDDFCLDGDPTHRITRLNVMCLKSALAQVVAGRGGLDLWSDKHLLYLKQQVLDSARRSFPSAALPSLSATIGEARAEIDFFSEWRLGKTAIEVHDLSIDWKNLQALLSLDHDQLAACARRLRLRGLDPADIMGRFLFVVFDSDSKCPSICHLWFAVEEDAAERNSKSRSHGILSVAPYASLNPEQLYELDKDTERYAFSWITICPLHESYAYSALDIWAEMKRQVFVYSPVFDASTLDDYLRVTPLRFDLSYSVLSELDNVVLMQAKTANLVLYWLQVPLLPVGPHSWEFTNRVCFQSQPEIGDRDLYSAIFLATNVFSVMHEPDR